MSNVLIGIAVFLAINLIVTLLLIRFGITKYTRDDSWRQK